MMKVAMHVLMHTCIENRGISVPKGWKKAELLEKLTEVLDTEALEAEVN